MKKSMLKKMKYGMFALALAGAVSVCGSKEVKAEEIPSEKVVEGLLGKWCVTGGHADETIEFFDDGVMILTSGGAAVNGAYFPNEENHVLYYALEGASETQSSGGTLYWKQEGDHLALLGSETDMELEIMTAYYTREDTIESYDTEDDIEGLARRAWTVSSGVESIEIDGEEYEADQMYYVFGMNLLQVGQPKNMGDGYYTKMLYAPYEYSDDCSTITFFFNNPFSEEIGVSYSMELSENELKFVGEDGEEIIFEAVEVVE